MLHPDESQLEIENHSLVEAQLSSGRYRWLDLVARRWAILLEDTLYSELRMMSTTESRPVVWTRFEDLCDPAMERPIFIFETQQKGKALLLLESDFVRSVTSSEDSEDQGDPAGRSDEESSEKNSCHGSSVHQGFRTELDENR